MAEGIVPDEFKIAKVIPVHKSNAKVDISTYRPISLLPSISKILGIVVYKRTLHFIQTNKILNNNQYGFREKHSTINAITALTSDVIKALENKDSVSILGPLLFIIYINDLPFCVEHCKIILFADDTTIYKSGKQVNNIYEDMNKEVQILANWFRANKLSLNISKTKCMLFCRSPPHESEEIILAMYNTVIQRMKCVHFLCLHIDEKLDWHEHINKSKNKLTSVFYVIKKVNSYLPVSALKTIYYTLVYPYLTYAIILWGSTYKTYLTKLYIIPKK